MLASISPLGERARQQTWGVTVGAYLIGSAAGGGLAGAVLGAAGAVVVGGGPAVQLTLAGLVAALAALADARRVALPTLRRQVNENWLSTYRGWVYGLGFGFQLGTGVMTIVTTASVYAVLGLALVTGSVAGGTAVGLVFGIVRALPVLALRGVHSPADLRAFHARMQHLDRPARRASVLVALAVAAALLSLGGVR